MGYQRATAIYILRRPWAIETPLGDSKLLLQNFSGSEGLNLLFDSRPWWRRAMPCEGSAWRRSTGEQNTLAYF
jgi:hypothetical protein